MEMAQEDLLNTVTNVLGLSISQREVLCDDGYDTTSTIIYWEYNEIRECCTNKYKFTTTRGGATYREKKSSTYRRCHSGLPI